MAFYPLTGQDLITAINAANQAGGSQTIELQAGAVYTLTQAHSTVDGPNGLPSITCNMTLIGNGATIRRVSTALFRLFHIAQGKTVTIKGLHITGGRIEGHLTAGGGIYNRGNLTLLQCKLTNNVASGGGVSYTAYGGAIENFSQSGQAPLTLKNCVLSGNSADVGGGLHTVNGAVTIQDCTLSKNQATVDGGAIEMLSSQVYGSYFVVISRSTLSENRAARGGAIHNDNSSLNISKSTLSNNVGGCISSIMYTGSISFHTALSSSRIFGNTGAAYSITNTTGSPTDARNNWWGSADGPSGQGSGSGDSVGPNVAYQPFVTTDASRHTAKAVCPWSHGANDMANGSNPISLRKGEKRIEATDLQLSTPAGALAFKRFYGQQRLNDPNYRYMGLGWSHNHAAQLIVSGTSPYRTAEALLSEGTVSFREISVNTFSGDAGSTAWLSYAAGEYKLGAQDGAEYIFDGTTLRLKRCNWPNAETWTYTYIGDNLSEINDGYGRKLAFSYINNPGQYDHGQLWRVGDHTATGLDTGNPSGRYVQFGYMPEMSNGVPISNPKALLLSVRDSRGQFWYYDYFGQYVGESDPDRLNFLTRRLSPWLDSNGDGVIDAAFTLERLSYTLSGLNMVGVFQRRGIWGTDPGSQDDDPALLESTFAFQVGGQEATTEAQAGRVTTHRFERGLYAGAEDPAGNYGYQTPNDQFRVAAQTDANGNFTWLNWSDDGRHLDSVADMQGHETSFSYNVNHTLNYSLDAEERKTTYTYGDANNPRLPTEVKVLDTDGTTVLRWQKYSYDSKGRTLSERTVAPSDGVTVLQETTRSYYTSGNGAGLLHTLTQKDIGGANDVTTTYSYDSAGRVVKTQRSSNFGACDIAYTVYDAAGNVVASLCKYDPGANPDPTTAAEAVALFNPAYPDKNRVTTHTYDPLGRRFKTTVHAGASYAQTTLTVLDALDRVVRTIGNYVADASVPQPFIASRSAFDHGADQTQNLVTDTAYNARGMVRQQIDVLGNVTLFGYDDAGRLVKTVQNAGQPDYNNDYGGVNPDPALANYVPSSDPDCDLITTRQYDPAGNLVKAVDALGSAAFTVYDALNRPVKTVRSAKAAASVDLEPGEAGYDAANDPRSVDYVLSADPDRDLVDLTTYDALGRVVETKRLFENRPAAQWVVMRQVYDALGRQVKSITSYVPQGTSDPAAWLWDAVDRRWEDGSGNAIDHGAASDQNLITETVYDAQGRVLFTRNLNGECTWSAYDGLGRQVKTIANAVGTATDGGANDPRSESYTPNAGPDRDLVSRTRYDADGRVRWSQDPVGRKTWYVYDTLGRQMKVIRNCTYVSGTPAPEDASYVGSTDPDKDRITRTVYDSQGRVWKTIDERGNETRYEYDTLGRRTTTIANYVDGVYNPALPDEDLIQTTSYDLAGRVVSVIDAAGTETRYEYDAAGRRIQTISNYVDGLYNPALPDEDLITTTTYNKGGQVAATTDARGTQTAFAYDAAGRQRQATSAAGSPQASSDYTCYDKAGRRLRAIQNYRPEPTDPSPDARDAQGNWLFAPSAHDLLDDANRVTTFTLDKLGRVLATSDPLGNGQDTAYASDGAVQAVTDPEGVAAQYRSDRLGRRALVVQGYTPAATDPAQWVWDAADGRWEDQ